MRRLRALWVRIDDAAKPGRRDRDFNEELASHLQLHIDDNIAAGMASDEARRAAIVKLGGIVQTQERYRDRARLPFVDAAVAGPRLRRANRCARIRHSRLPPS